MMVINVNDNIHSNDENNRTNDKINNLSSNDKIAIAGYHVMINNNINHSYDR